MNKRYHSGDYVRCPDCKGDEHRKRCGRCSSNRFIQQSNCCSPCVSCHPGEERSQPDSPSSSKPMDVKCKMEEEKREQARKERQRLEELEEERQRKEQARLKREEEQKKQDEKRRAEEEDRNRVELEKKRLEQEHERKMKEERARKQEQARIELQTKREEQARKEEHAASSLQCDAVSVPKTNALQCTDAVSVAKIVKRVKKAGGNTNDDAHPLSISLSWGTIDDLDLWVEPPRTSAFEKVGKTIRCHYKTKSGKSLAPWPARIEATNDGTMDVKLRGAGCQTIPHDWCTHNERIYHRNKNSTRSCGGKLDVDANAKDSDLTYKPVENVVWSNLPSSGEYIITVHNFKRRSPKYRCGACYKDIPDRTCEKCYWDGTRAECGDEKKCPVCREPTVEVENCNCSGSLCTPKNVNTIRFRLVVNGVPVDSEVEVSNKSGVEYAMTVDSSSGKVKIQDHLQQTFLRKTSLSKKYFSQI